MDSFNEYMVRRKKSGVDIAKMAAMIVGAIVLILILLLFAQFLGSFLLLAVVGVGYLLYIGINMQKVEFEYSVTNGELDIDKITAQRKRKRVVSVRSRDFEYFAPKTAEHMSAYNDSTVTARIDATSNTGDEGVYFAIYFKNNLKTCMSFEPTEKMLNDFARFAPRNSFHK